MFGLHDVENLDFLNIGFVFRHLTFNNYDYWNFPSIYTGNSIFNMNKDSPIMKHLHFANYDLCAYLHENVLA